MRNISAEREREATARKGSKGKKSRIGGVRDIHMVVKSRSLKSAKSRKKKETLTKKITKKRN